jgi:pathogenesis-related protein 1
VRLTRSQLWVACLFACPTVAACKETGETGRLKGITDAHNAIRADVSNPTPDPALPELEWSDDLADVAQDWADELADRDCALQHSSGQYGENLAWFGGQQGTAEQVVEAWASEVACYEYGRFMDDDQCSAQCDDSGGCGHYTQVVWRDTREVGCGLATCSGDREVWVCNYDPPGNYIGQLPY